MLQEEVRLYMYNQLETMKLLVVTDTSDVPEHHKGEVQSGGSFMFHADDDTFIHQYS